MCASIAPAPTSAADAARSDRREVRIGPLGLAGALHVPAAANALVVFAHGSGSSRFSPRNMAVANALNEQGMATLLFDLLTPDEEENRANVFDIPLLAERLIAVVHWIDQRAANSASCRLACSAPAPARRPRWSPPPGSARASAPWYRAAAGPISRMARLTQVTAPTLLIVGGLDYGVIELNEQAFARLRAPKALEIVPGATHLFPEPGALEPVIELAAHWFKSHLGARRAPVPESSRSRSCRSSIAPTPAGSSPRRSRLQGATARGAGLAARRRAGRRGDRGRARRAARSDPGAQDRRAVVSRNSPWAPSSTASEPMVVRNESVIRLAGVSEAGIQRDPRPGELAEIERRRKLYLGDRPHPQIPAGPSSSSTTALPRGDNARRFASHRMRNRTSSCWRFRLRRPTLELRGEAEEIVCLEDYETSAPSAFLFGFQPGFRRKSSTVGAPSGQSVADFELIENPNAGCVGPRIYQGEDCHGKVPVRQWRECRSCNA